MAIFMEIMEGVRTFRLILAKKESTNLLIYRNSVSVVPKMDKKKRETQVQKNLFLMLPKLNQKLILV